MSQSLPVIVGFGGYNAAGRSSSHQAFRRMVLESLSPAEQRKTIVGLACLMGCVSQQAEDYSDNSGTRLTAEQVETQFRDRVLDGTLVRKIESFDPAAVPGNKKITFDHADCEQIIFTMLKRDLPRQCPDDWQICDLEGPARPAWLSKCCCMFAHNIACNHTYRIITCGITIIFSFILVIWG